MTAEELAAIQNIVLIVTGIVGTVIAVFGYREWHKQLRGTDRYNAGKKIIAAICDFRDGIDLVRNPFMFSSEYRYSEEEQKNITNEVKSKGIERAYLERLKVLNQARASIIIAGKECEVLQGIGYIEEIKPLLLIYAKVVTAVEEYLEEKAEGRLFGNRPDSEKEWRKEQRAILYKDFNDKDSLSMELNVQIISLEKRIRVKFGV